MSNDIVGVVAYKYVYGGKVYTGHECIYSVLAKKQDVDALKKQIAKQLDVKSVEITQVRYANGIFGKC